MDAALYGTFFDQSCTGFSRAYVPVQRHAAKTTTDRDTYLTWLGGGPLDAPECLPGGATIRGPRCLPVVGYLFERFAEDETSDLERLAGGGGEILRCHWLWNAFSHGVTQLVLDSDIDHRL